MKCKFLKKKTTRYTVVYLVYVVYLAESFNRKNIDWKPALFSLHQILCHKNTNSSAVWSRISISKWKNDSNNNMLIYFLSIEWGGATDKAVFEFALNYSQLYAPV